MPLRKLIIPALAALIIALGLLHGCSAKQLVPREPESPLAGRSGNFDTAAVISYKELQATATVSQNAPDACTVTFTSPESIKDMAFVFRQDAVDVQYKGLGFQFDPESTPGGAIAKVMVSAINRSMKNDGVRLGLTEGGLELTGTLEAGDFTLRLDPEQGNLLKLSVPAEELEIEFMNFRFLD